MAIMGGNVGIGTIEPDKLLHVAGDARIEGDIYYDAGASTYPKPDFVFDKEYNKEFEIFEIERFIKENNHLPWLTSSKNELMGKASFSIKSLYSSGKSSLVSRLKSGITLVLFCAISLYKPFLMLV